MIHQWFPTFCVSHPIHLAIPTIYLYFKLTILTNYPLDLANLFNQLSITFSELFEHFIYYL